MTKLYRVTTVNGRPVVITDLSEKDLTNHIVKEWQDEEDKAILISVKKLSSLISRELRDNPNLIGD